MTHARELKETTDGPHTSKTNAPRPGPFGPAWALLPEGQQLEVIASTEATSSALDRLVGTGFSQVPVVDEARNVIGVFTWRSFGRRMSEIHQAKVDLDTLPVRDTDLEPPNFISPDTYIDTATDWSQIDYVLVGTPDQPLGILTNADVLGRLNDFAEAFVLLYEIEHGIRDIFRDVYSPAELDSLTSRLAERRVRPEAHAAKALKALIEGDEPVIRVVAAVNSIKKAVDLLTKASRPQALQGLEDFTFSQYREIIFDRDEWPRFDEVFNLRPEILNPDFEAVNTIRNDVFHFRRKILPRDTDRLRRFRDRRRSDLLLFRRRSESSQADGTSGHRRLPR